MSIELIGNKLAIFERFQTDNNLTKHVKKEVKRAGQRFIMEPDYVEEDESNEATDEVSWKMASPVIWTEKVGFFKRIRRKILRYFDNRNLPKLPPEETMKIVFERAEQLQVFAAKQQTVENLIKVAKENGQTALVEDLKSKQAVLVYEAALIVLGYSQYISENALVSLAKKSDRAFRLDWIKNFVRIIPEPVAEKKRGLDKSLIFDNYVILHYDPDGKGNKLTEADIAAKRDPILFGVLKGSQKLYFVADWKDDLCTLTFEELMLELEKNEIKTEMTLKEVDK